MKTRPVIVCLCGSTRFMEAFQAANLAETLAGKIVLSVGCNTKSDDMLGITEAQKAALDELHLHKINLADEGLFLNVAGYIGSSTKRELAYSIYSGKKIRFLDEKLGNEFMARESHALGKMVAGFLGEGR